METHKHLSLDWCREQFSAKPTSALARWYLGALLRHLAAEKLSIEQYLDELKTIKDWMKENKL